MARSQETTMQRVQLRFQNAMKQGKNLGPLFPQCGHKTFLHQNLVWSSLEMLTRAGIVRPRIIANTLSMQATQIVTIQSAVHILRAGV